MTTLNLSSAPLISLTFHSAGGSYEIRVSDGFGGFYTEGHSFGTDGNSPGLRRWSASGRGAAMQRCALTLPWQTVRLKG